MKQRVKAGGVDGKKCILLSKTRKYDKHSAVLIVHSQDHLVELVYFFEVCNIGKQEYFEFKGRITIYLGVVLQQSTTMKIRRSIFHV